MFKCPIKAPVSENVKVANLFLVGFVRYFIWFLFALSHIRQREEQLESESAHQGPDDLHSNLFHWTLYCVVWEGQLCGAILYVQVTSSGPDSLHSSSWSGLSLWMLNFMYWGGHGKIHSVLLNLCFKILFMNENRMGYRKTFGSRIWKRYFSHYLWLHLCIWNLSLCM